MATRILFISLLFVARISFAQNDSIAIAEIKKFQDELNLEYKGDESPLSVEDKNKFTAHEFFPINLKFRVRAKLKVTANTPFFTMKATSIRTAEYRKYGVLEFVIEGNKFQIPVYQSYDLMRTKGYEDYLFFPFTDLTNGNETYHGGRYVELRIPTGEEIIVDFNKAYNPYCAYSSKYSCPLVPTENNLNIRIEAGVKYHSKK